MIKKCDVLVLGATGMLGNTILRYFHARSEFSTAGTIRGFIPPAVFSGADYNIVSGVDVSNADCLVELFSTYRPTVVINCIGLVKQLSASEDPLNCMPINSLLPHRLAALCGTIGARLVHISTDCVFDGKKGMYLESDWPNARDLYGRSKLLGEVSNLNAITLRTSIIGHEMGVSHSLLEWFLSQDERAHGFRKAIFSGLPTVELARVIHDFVLPEPSLNGVYHVSSDPIDKFSLLKLFASEYSKNTDVIPNDELIIDRSLDSKKFRTTTGFMPNCWEEMVRLMREFG